MPLASLCSLHYDVSRQAVSVVVLATLWTILLVCSNAAPFGTKLWRRVLSPCHIYKLELILFLPPAAKNDPSSLLSLLEEGVITKLEDAKKKLGQLASTEFERAIKNKDQQAVSRFAKLFYPLGLADSAVGVYIQFIRETVREGAQKEIQRLRKMKIGGGARAGGGDMPPYSDALEQVFFHICEVLSANKENIEMEFGIDNYVTFLKGICAEVSQQQVRIITLFREQEYQKFLSKAGSGGQLSKDVREHIGIILFVMQDLSHKSENFDFYIRSLITEAYAEQRKNEGASNEKEIEEIIHSIVGGRGGFRDEN